MESDVKPTTSEPDKILPELHLDGVANPELVFGLVGPLGSPMENVIDALDQALKAVGYESHTIRLSSFLEAYQLNTPHPPVGGGADERWNALMSRGNELRELLDRGDALAIHAAAEIGKLRVTAGTPSRALEGQAIILRQVKHPEEVQLLRKVYGSAFHLIGVFTPESVRDEYLRNVKNLTPEKAQQLIQRDAGEEFKHGQQVTKTYHLSDLFLDVPGWRDVDLKATKTQLERYVGLLFGLDIITPTVDEYGMYLAQSAALRSADLSRQVGAAILSDKGEVIALGANEVPRAGGGQYWPGEGDDRDYQRGHDSNEVIKLACVAEVVAHLSEGWEDMVAADQKALVAEAAKVLSRTRLMNLTEFGRAVHAEMEAILSATRVGLSARGHVLFTTTFPCHNCAKHIVGAGISRVVYVEPYPKSLADRLHGDAIAFSLNKSVDEKKPKIPFEAFVGVSPRRFPELFSTIRLDGTRIARKGEGGQIRTKTVDLRTKAVPLSHVDREAILADFLDQLVENVNQLSLELK